MNKEYPKVSIITCVYNGEKYISKLLDSVLNMGYPNIEHIIVNDGSTDSTEEIVKKYAGLYKNKVESDLSIKYIKQTNKGLGYSTITGLNNVTGKYWTWINCDDWYEDNFCQELVSFLEKNESYEAAVANGYWAFLKSGRKIPMFNKKQTKIMRKAYSSDVNFIKQFSWGYYKHTLYVVKSEAYKRITDGKYFYPVRYTQDVQLSVQIFLSLKTAFIDQKLFSLGLHEGQLYASIANDGKKQVVINAAAGASLFFLNNEKKYEWFYNIFIINYLLRTLWYDFRNKNKASFKSNWQKYKIVKSVIKKEKYLYKKYLPVKVLFKKVILHIYSLMIILF